MSFSSTIQALENLTDFSNFERLCCDLLSCFKYEGIVPRGVGKIDGGIDAVFVSREEDAISSILKKTVFHFSTRKDCKAKLYEDLRNTAKHDPKEVVFVTNRRIEPLTQDWIIKDVKDKYIWKLTIYDQEWLRIPLDTDYQDLRRKYLGIPEQLTVFENLDNILKNEYRHPNVADFEDGRYYRNELFHSAIEVNLKAHRICLIKGKPGSGKTALALSIGYDLIRESPKNIVLYLTADSRSSCKDWLSQIQQGDHPHVLYIIDNCHNAIDDVNELIDRWHRINNAKILLITRSIAPETAGTTDMNYLTILEDKKCVLNNDVTAEVIRQIIKCQRPSDSKKEIGDENKIYEKCQGDLHLLNFYMSVWQKEINVKPLSDIQEEEILDDVYSRYFLDSPTRDYVKSACPLWRFEIPVQIGWRCGSEERDIIQKDAFIEGFVSAEYEHPLHFFRYFHSTPANYLLNALYIKGLLGKSIFEYTKDQVIDYLSIKPANFFNIFYRLHKNGEESLAWALLNEGSVLEKYGEIITQKDIHFLINQLLDIVSFLITVRNWEDSKKGKAYEMFHLFVRKVGKENLSEFIESQPSQTILALILIGVIDQEFRDSLLFSLNLNDMTAKMEDTGLATVMRFLQLTKQAGVDRGNLNAFCEGLDFGALGKRSRETGLATVMKFLQLTKQAGVDRSNLNAFCEGLDFGALGERSREIGLATVRTFLELTKQAGVERGNLNAFCEGLDFGALGERSRDTGLANVMNFLRLTTQVGVRSKILKSFCEGLDWKTLGKYMGTKMTELKNPFFELHSVQSYDFISKDMALLFIEGVGWNTLNKSISVLFSPDVLAAVVNLLTNKCTLNLDELTEKGLELSPHRTWINSFVNNPCPRIEPNQQLIQQNYLNYAGSCFMKYAEKEFIRKSHKLPLKSWNILIHNISAACPDYLEEGIIPFLKNVSTNRLEELFCESDLLNIGIFLSKFNPDNGIFKWSIPEGIAFRKIDFSEKIKDCTLQALSHFLFNFYFISRDDCSNLFADQLDNDYSTVIPKIADAGIAEIDFFFWNLWMALPKGKKPNIFRDERISEIILEKAVTKRKDKEAILGVIGTLQLTEVPVNEELIKLLDAEKAKSLCRKAVKEGSVKCIRLLGGSLLLLPKNDLKKIYNDFQEMSFQFNIHVPNQIETINSIKAIIKETISDF